MKSLEAMAYKMQPAGHDKPAPKRKFERDSRLDRLVAQFELWQKCYPTIINPDYEHRGLLHIWAKEAIKGLNPSIEEAHALLLRIQDTSRFPHTGLFISAIYNTSPEKEIVFDFDMPDLDHLGFWLQKDKIFINKGVLPSLGEKAEGTIINYNTIKNTTYGNVVNYGKIEKCGTSSEGLTVNLGKIKELDSYSRSAVINASKYGSITFVNQEGIVVDTTNWTLMRFSNDPPHKKRKYTQKGFVRMHKAREYFSELVKKFEQGKNDYHMAISAVKQYPVEKVRKDLISLMKEAGYEA